MTSLCHFQKGRGHQVNETFFEEPHRFGVEVNYFNRVLVNR